MMEQFQEWDEILFLAINGAGHPHLDGLMLFLSARLVWIPLYLALIFLLYRHFGNQFWKPLLLVLLAVTLSDQLTASVMKPFFERLRPCKNQELADLMVLVGNCGGKYGFASSHAANTFALAVFFFNVARIRWYWLLVFWAFLVSYSRVYLGVHYPGDVLVGGLIGAGFGYVLSILSKRMLPQ